MAAEPYTPNPTSKDAPGPSEFDPFVRPSTNAEAATLVARRQARLAGDPIPPLAGELRRAE